MNTFPSGFPLQVDPSIPSPRLRIAVNTGSCGLALGAGQLVTLWRSTLTGKNGEVEIYGAGCDGACFQAYGAREISGTGEEYRLGSPDTDVSPFGGLSRASSFQETPFYAGQRRRLLANCGRIDPLSIDSAIDHGAYRGLWRALTALTPEAVIDEIDAADLRGRGGAYFPTGRKWRSARGFPEPRFIVVNAEEGEPAVFKDRHLIEGDPHLLIEGLLIAAYATGASKGFIYLNGIAHNARRTLRIALDQARQRGILGERVLGADFAFEVELRSGAGGYVLGEESVLLNSIEGRRSVPRTRPPFPTEAGLWASPTVINNAETLCNVPLILREGVERFREGAGANGAGTKLVSLSGAVQRPGLVEVAMGTSLRTVVFDIGGGAPEGKRITGVVAGGPSGGLLSVDSLDIPARPGALHASGAVLGSGGLVVLDDSLPVVEVVRHLTEYNRNESCGKCTPCREGSDQMLEILARAAQGEAGADDLDRLLFLGEVATSASLCGLGQMAANPITSALNQFPDAFAAAFGREGR